MRPPQPFGSAAQRWCHALVKGLRECGHRVTIFAPFADEEAQELRQQLERVGEPLVRWPQPARAGLLTRLRSRIRPFGFDHDRRDAAELRRHAADIDWWLCDETLTGWAGCEVAGPVLLHTHCLRTIDFAGHEFPPRQRSGVRRMLAAERSLVRRFSWQATASPVIADQIHAWNPAARVELIPLTLDLSLYPVRDPGAQRAADRASFFGSLSWATTADAAKRLARDLWPAIRARRPGASLEFAGDGTRELLGEFNGANGIDVKGRVAAIEPLWRAAGALLFPLERGTGAKIKVLEALAHGVPVVTTPAGAEGLELADGESALICRGDREFVDASVRLLGDPALQARLAAAGRRHLETRLALTSVAGRFAAFGAAMVGEGVAKR